MFTKVDLTPQILHFYEVICFPVLNMTDLNQDNE